MLEITVAVVYVVTPYNFTATVSKILLLALNNYPSKTKRRLLYLKTQSVPRCKHFSSRL